MFSRFGAIGLAVHYDQWKRIITSGVRKGVPSLGSDVVRGGATLQLLRWGVGPNIEVRYNVRVRRTLFRRVMEVLCAFPVFRSSIARNAEVVSVSEGPSGVEAEVEAHFGGGPLLRFYMTNFLSERGWELSQGDRIQAMVCGLAYHVRAFDPSGEPVILRDGRQLDTRPITYISPADGGIVEPVAITTDYIIRGPILAVTRARNSVTQQEVLCLRVNIAEAEWELAANAYDVSGEAKPGNYVDAKAWLQGPVKRLTAVN